MIRYCVVFSSSSFAVNEVHVIQLDEGANENEQYCFLPDELKMNCN